MIWRVFLDIETQRPIQLQRRGVVSIDEQRELVEREAVAGNLHESRHQFPAQTAATMLGSDNQTSEVYVTVAIIELPKRVQRPVFVTQEVGVHVRPVAILAKGIGRKRVTKIRATPHIDVDRGSEPRHELVDVIAFCPSKVPICSHYYAATWQQTCGVEHAVREVHRLRQNPGVAIC